MRKGKQGGCVKKSRKKIVEYILLLTMRLIIVNSSLVCLKSRISVTSDRSLKKYSPKHDNNRSFRRYTIGNTTFDIIYFSICA